ncbi:MAG: DUF308 domain-containing protein [Bacteroidales bacterium]|nr:DUF308 domain-containing protein [Bacteroidales bacterium]
MKSIINFQTSLYLLLHGIVAILIGLLFAIASQEIFRIVVLSIGLLLTISGIVITWMAFSGKRIKTETFRYPALFQGILLVGLGLFITFNLQMMEKMIILLFGLWAVVAGGSQIYYGLLSKENFKQYKTLIVNGLLLVILGLVMAITQEKFVDLIGKIVGFSAIFLGLTTFIFAIILYFKRPKTSEQSELESD